MRGDMVNDFLFNTGFVYQANAALREVTNAAVEQTARAAAGAGSKIVLINQTDAQTAHGGITSDARADDAAADDEYVQWFFSGKSGGLLASFGKGVHEYSLSLIRLHVTRLMKI